MGWYVTFQPGDIVEIRGLDQLFGGVHPAVAKAEVKQHSSSRRFDLIDGVPGMQVYLPEGPLDPRLTVTLVSSKGAPASTKKCGTCKRDADAGKPCWWCGTKMP